MRLAWYSPKYDKLYGSVIWKDKDGNHVQCSMVGESKEDFGQFFKAYPDAVYRGIVVEWVSSPDVDWAEMEFMVDPMPMSHMNHEDFE